MFGSNPATQVPGGGAASGIRFDYTSDCYSEFGYENDVF